MCGLERCAGLQEVSVTKLHWSCCCALVGVEAVGVRHCCADYLLQHLQPPTGGSGGPWKTVELREVTVLSPGSHLEGVRWKTDLVLLHWSCCDWIGTGECAVRLHRLSKYLDGKLWLRKVAVLSPGNHCEGVRWETALVLL